MNKVCILSCVHSALDNRVFYREARSLHKGGYEVTLIAIHDKSEVRDGIRIVGLPKISRWKRPIYWLKLLNLAKRTKADIYHFHDPELLLISPILKLITKKPIIYDIHEAYPDFIKVKDYLPVWVRYPIAWIFKWIEPLLGRFQNGLIFSDNEIALAFNSISIPKLTLYNFPSLEFIENARWDTKDLEKREPIILYLGGLERNRGTRLMVEAFESVLQKKSDARLLLVGHFMPPELQSEVEEDIKIRNIQNAVTIMGRVPFDTIGEYLRRSAIGWLTWQPYAKNEKNIPTKLFEYMAYGLPIVSSSLRSTRPFIQDGENGYLVTPDSPKAHAEAMLNILNNENLGRKMGLKGQELVRSKYNWKEMESRLFDFYSVLINKTM
jgi:glycosyltransferase involved in cell wall biosynthesis